MDDFPITPLTPEETESGGEKALREGYVHRSMVALDIAANVVTDGYPDETISSRAARAALQRKPWGIVLSAFLNLFDKDHGAKAQAADMERAEEIIGIETSAGDLNKQLRR